MGAEEDRMQLQIDRLAAAVNGLTERVSRSETRQEENHKQNRSDIHTLRNMHQVIIDTLHEGMDKIADRLGDDYKELRTDVVSLKIQSARTLGYAAGVAGAAVVIFEVAKWVIESHK